MKSSIILSSKEFDSLSAYSANISACIKYSASTFNTTKMKKNQVINHNTNSKFRIPNSEFLKTSAILLAAGLSRRMGKEDKLLLTYHGKPLLQHAIDLLADLPVWEKILITTKEKLNHVRIPDEIKLILNKSPHIGQSESVKLGVKAASGHSYLFMAADQPKLTIKDINPILSAAQKNKDKIVYPKINGKPTTPTIFPSCFQNELLTLVGDLGGRTIRNEHPESRIAVEVENPANFIEIDDIEDYNKLDSIKTIPHDFQIPQGIASQVRKDLIG